MGHYDFKRDLANAQKTEKEVSAILRDYHNIDTIAFNKTSDYDLLCVDEHGMEVTYEIKEDFLCRYTGNVGLVFECRGKSSGIVTSKAYYFIYKVHTANGVRFILHKTPILRDMVNEEKYFRIVNGGDKNSNSMNYLFRYEVFAETGEDITP